MGAFFTALAPVGQVSEFSFVNLQTIHTKPSKILGWKGLTCADGSEALSEKRLLLNFLLLTVSNAAFIPAIIVAAARRYFTESAVYFITMVSSAVSTSGILLINDHSFIHCLNPPAVPRL